MRSLIAILFVLSSCPVLLCAQTYEDSIYQYRKHYQEEFLTDTNSPLTAADTGWLRFFAPDPQYRVAASFTRAHSAASFEIATHSGKTKTYKEYGLVRFTWKGKPCILHLYQSMTLIKQDKYRNHLFLPFTDLTNYEETYGGGRYIDLSTDDIQNGSIVIDFNKCYNPYCAFGGSYSCPIPPEENKLNFRMEAGEKKFAGKIKE